MGTNSLLARRRSSFVFMPRAPKGPLPSCCLDVRALQIVLAKRMSKNTLRFSKGGSAALKLSPGMRVGNHGQTPKF